MSQTKRELAAPSHITAIQPYIPGKPIDDLVREFGLSPDAVVKLASNENPLGMPDSARQAIADAVSGLGRYPDPGGYELKQLISTRLRVPASWITLGNGSNDILEMVGMALLDHESSAVYSEYSFVVYRLATQARGARHIMIKAKDYGHDLPAMLEAIDQTTKVVFIANPNNPTGTFLTKESIAWFLAEIEKRHGNRVVVVLDEAYNEYLLPELRVDSVELVRQYSNLLVSRSFSKAYGLAGLRVGYALAQPALTELLARVRQPFNVNTLAQAAAMAAFQDEAFLAESARVNASGKNQLETAFAQLDLEFVPSYANFVLVRVGDAAMVNQELLKRGVIVRPVASDGLPEWLRVSIGLEQENARFIEALKDIMATHGKGN
ncbi:histidinol-phosphate transaminase [Orrella marina]|uniref:Histidinol-phosphate aminotransferase n=1 Tax=Orrella marina TaxID=2163011 RepID=A0A2R4XJV0_9BURK|nr:histidinol-phosphate transaminase [Orrella marina]AWB34048.1 histidinol-phosphate transaminase [Orrella marina]